MVWLGEEELIVQGEVDVLDSRRRMALCEGGCEVRTYVAKCVKDVEVEVSFMFSVCKMSLEVKVDSEY